MGMGGAFTAVADDESAFYWNPAGITQVRFASLMFGVGAQGEDFDFIEDTIDNLDDAKRLDFHDFEDGRGYLNLGLIGGITTRYVGVNFYSETSVDTEKEGLRLNVKASSFNYGAVTIAANIREKIAVGCNIKKVIAGKGGGLVEVNEITLEDSKSTTSYGDGDGMAFDLGVLYRLSDQVKLGFIARNIGGEIDFDVTTTNHITSEELKDPETVDLPREYAVGVSYRPFKNTLLAGDIQKCDARLFTKEQTRIRIGLEQTALWNIFALRLGAYTNKDESLAFTAGLGFKLGPLAIGLAGVREEYDGKKADEALATVGIRF